MKYLSLFSGVEAATLAWQPLGWKAVGFSEIEPFPCAVLEQRYPETPNYGDVNGHCEWKIEPPDLIVGGSPCQAFSVEGIRKGFEDPRGNLTLTYLSCVDVFRPRWVVWENVPGVLSHDGGRTFGAFLGALGELGYGFAYRVLDAQNFGVPQRRRRVFVVGCIGGDWLRAASVLFEPEGLSRHPKPRPKAKPQAPSGAGAGTGEPLTFDRQACDSYGMAGVASTINARDYKSPIDLVVHPIHDKATRHAGATGKGSGNGLGVGSNGDPSPTLTTGDKHAVAYSILGDPTTKIDEGICGALRSQGAGGVVPPSVLTPEMVARRLTPIECERLQGMPDDWTRIAWRGKPPDECPDGPRYRAIGNSMAVPVMRWIGQRLYSCELNESREALTD